jgi:formyl-CoA transferase
MMEGALPEYDLFGEIRERTGSNLTGIVPSNTYLTRDGQHVVIGANADSIFRRLMKAIGREDLAADESLADNAGRAKRAEELDRAIGAWTAKLDADDVVRTLNQIQVPGGKIYSMADIARDAQYLARDMIRQVRLKDGTPLKVPGIVPKLSATPGDIDWIGAQLGEHTESVLAPGFSERIPREAGQFETRPDHGRTPITIKDGRCEQPQGRFNSRGKARSMKRSNRPETVVVRSRALIIS